MGEVPMILKRAAAASWQHRRKKTIDDIKNNRNRKIKICHTFIINECHLWMANGISSACLYNVYTYIIFFLALRPRWIHS